MTDFGFSLCFEGNDADNHELDSYDAAEALVGFQRSLALTTHLILNGEVITQAPSLKNARILVSAPEKGSLKLPARIIAASTLLYTVGTAPKETPLGHLVHSGYDHIINELTGCRVDYDKSLGEMYEFLERHDNHNLPILDQSNFDSLAEKCENAIREMHRPIVKSESATQAKIFFQSKGEEKPLQTPLNHETFEFIKKTIEDDEIFEITGRVSSYNINTFKGRLYSISEKRPIPFILGDTNRDEETVLKITRSLSRSARSNFVETANIECKATKYRSSAGRLKGYRILDIA